MDLYRKNKVLWTMALAAEEFYNVLALFLVTQCEIANIQLAP